MRQKVPKRNLPLCRKRPRSQKKPSFMRAIWIISASAPFSVAIIFAAIIIGAMGAVMDVAMSLSSSLHELKLKVMSISPKELFKSGMVIGRDMMGTMANTLVLAYIGSSLTVTVLIVIYNSSMTELLNKERIVVEILQALVLRQRCCICSNLKSVLNIHNWVSLS